VQEFYAGLGKPVRVGLEASGYSQWLEEMLEELGIERWVGDPARIRNAAPLLQRPHPIPSRNPILHSLKMRTFDTVSLLGFTPNIQIVCQDPSSPHFRASDSLHKR